MEDLHVYSKYQIKYAHVQKDIIGKELSGKETIDLSVELQGHPTDETSLDEEEIEAGGSGTCHW